MPQGLADTLCGSPLYMAPEIIQNKKYDAKVLLVGLLLILVFLAQFVKSCLYHPVY